MKVPVLSLLVLALIGLVGMGCANPQPLPNAPTAIPTLIPATMPPPGVAAPVPAAVGVVYPASPPSTQAGQAIYQANCASCHGPDGKGLVEGARDFTDADYLRGAVPLDFYRSVSEGKAEMPAFKDTLSTQDRWDVTFHLWSFSVGADQLAAGKSVYQANCVACHGADGKGSIPQAPALTSVEFIARTPASTFYKSVTGGKGIMPAWQDRLSADERWASVEYARSFAYRPLGN